MFTVLSRAFTSLLHPKMLALMLVPVAVAVAIWLLAALMFWGQAVAWIDIQMRNWDTLQWLLAYWPLTLIAAHSAVVVLVAALMPVVLITIILVTGIFAMPIMVSHIGARNYPQLEKYRGGTFSGSAWNGIAALCWFLLLVAVTLPLWFFVPLWPLLSIGLLGYLNARVFRFDALAEHAGVDEIKRIVREDRWTLFGLGVCVAFAAHVPLLGFFSPVYGGLVFIHFGLTRLSRMRAHPLAGQSTRVFEGESIT